jgi:hypothetical protein
MNEALDKLLKLALENKELKTALLATQGADDPLDEFCRIACENGCSITVGEIFTLNQTLCDNLLKSTNGGATYPIEDWADAYEMFISALI